MRKNIPSIRLVLALFSWILPLTAFLSIWLPVLHHYHVKRSIIGNEIVEVSRNRPSDSVFQELNRVNLWINLASKNDAQTVIIAEQVLKGRIEIPGYPKVKFHMPFNSGDLQTSSSEWRLLFAGFALPDVLLHGYKLSLRDDFLNAAKDFILAWAEYESKSWLPTGLLWNDHAISNRMVVISKFWSYYRNHSDFDLETARVIFQIVDRGRKLLAKPSHFTFATNHGIMQNLALWHISIAFPFLPNIEYYRNLAFERMNEQMSFYISEEGVVLENSAGYHKKGLELLDISFRYLTLLNKPIPYDWKSKYDKAKDFYLQLRRPDGSLPVFGDTRRKEDPPNLLYTNIPQFKKDKSSLDFRENILKKSFTLFPLSGYSVWWDQLKDGPSKNRLSQTMVIWSNFPDHGHKHADEMSVLLWAYGQTWWTNSGYLPYGTQEREEAISWSGSNAPHLAGEHQKIKRVTRLLYAGNSADLAAIDLERNVQNNYKIRRQVINLFPNIWITIDHSTGNKRPVNTIWTAADDVNLQEGNRPGSFIFGPRDNRTLKLHKYILGSKGIRVYQNNSNLNNNAGLESKKVTGAASIIIEQPAMESWTAVIWLIKNAQLGYAELSRQPVIKKWNGSENWQLLIPLPIDSIIVSREKERIILSSIEKDTKLQELKLKKYTEDAGRQKHIHLSFERARHKYKKPDFSKSRRLKASYYLMGLFLFQLAASFFVKKAEQNYYYFFKMLSCLFWAGLIIFMHNFYF